MSEPKRVEEREEMREGDAEDVPVDPSGRVVHVRRRAARIKALRDQYGESPEALAIADDLVDLACCASDEMERLVRAAEADIHDGYKPSRGPRVRGDNASAGWEYTEDDIQRLIKKDISDIARDLYYYSHAAPFTGAIAHIERVLAARLTRPAVSPDVAQIAERLHDLAAAAVGYGHPELGVAIAEQADALRATSESPAEGES